VRVVVLVLSAEIEPYVSLENTIRNTWAKEKVPGVEIFYYYGGAADLEIIEDKIYSRYPEGLYNIGYKTLDAFQLIKNFNFDYLLRTNSSSYVIQENLLKFLQDKPRENFYSGVNYTYHESGSYHGGKFCSGAAYILSRDVFDKVLKSKSKWNHTLIDDVALGELITTHIKVDLNNQATRLTIEDVASYDLDLIKDHYHIRCKIGYDRRMDQYHMYNIHNLLNNNG